MGRQRRKRQPPQPMSVCGFSSRVREKPVADDAQLGEEEFNRRPDNPDPVHDASAEIYRRSLLEVFRGARYLPRPEANINGLASHLVVENEIVRAQMVRDAPES